MDINLTETVAIAFYVTVAVVVYGIVLAIWFKRKG